MKISQKKKELNDTFPKLDTESQDFVLAIVRSLKFAQNTFRKETSKQESVTIS